MHSIVLEMVFVLVPLLLVFAMLDLQVHLALILPVIRHNQTHAIITDHIATLMVNASIVSVSVQEDSQEWIAVLFQTLLTRALNSTHKFRIFLALHVYFTVLPMVLIVYGVRLTITPIIKLLWELARVLDNVPSMFYTLALSLLHLHLLLALIIVLELTMEHA